MSSEKDYYRLLGVSRDVPDREIKKAYYELARQLHPDKARSEEERAANADKLAAISKAYNALKDPRRRAEYDASLKGGRPATAAEEGQASPTPAPTSPSGSGGRTGAAMAPPPPPPGPSSQQAEGGMSQSMQFQQKKAMAQKAFVRGMQHFKRAEWRDALNFFQVAVTNDPESEPQYHIKLAQCLIRTKGSFTRAVEACETACQMDPYNMEFKLILADINETAGAVSRAKDIYEDVLRWDAGNQTAKNRLTLLGATSGNKGAGRMLDKITSLFSKKK